jgi:hypothetical protein
MFTAFATNLAANTPHVVPFPRRRCACFDVTEAMANDPIPPGGGSNATTLLSLSAATGRQARRTTLRHRLTGFSRRGRY